MKPTLFIAALALAAVAWPAGAGDVSVNDLIARVRSALAEKQPDKQAAKALGKLKLTERLDAVVSQELESEGAGPAVREQLERLRAEAEGLPAPQDRSQLFVARNPFDAPHSDATVEAVVILPSHCG